MATDLSACCSEIIGGEVYIIANFDNTSEYYEALGDVRIQPARIERTAGASSAGRVWVTEASRPIRVVMSFINRCDQNPIRLYCSRCLVDIVVVEKSRGFTHSLTQCLVVGAPEVNLSTGEISGIELVTDDYTAQQTTEVLGRFCPQYDDVSTPDPGPLGRGGPTA
jgi:hypothetical protein